jgi:flagellar FliL protein
MNEVNVPQTGAEGAAEAPGKKKSGKLLKGLLIVVAVVAAEVVVAMAVVQKYVVQNQPAPPDAAGTASRPEVEQSGQKQAGAIYEIPDIIVNPAGTQGMRFLSATVGLETHDPDLLEELEARQALVRDILIGILSSKRIEDLVAPAAKDSLRTEILKRLNPQLATGRVSRVYFTNYVIQ